MIKPSIGRQVLYQPLESEKNFIHLQPFAATVTHVWGETCVNLDVINEYGQHFFKSSCILAQDRAADAGEAEWMQYQIDQQAKADAAATAPATSSIAIGDTVVINSGGPDMSVIHVNEEDSIAHCTWFLDNKRFECGNFPIACLTKKDPVFDASMLIERLTDQAIEKEVVAKGLTAPRVTLADLNANITDIEIVKHASKSGQVLRWAVLTTLNGYAVVGRPSVGVSSENDDQDVGEKIAVENSRNELWPLMGYALKEALASDGS